MSRSSMDDYEKGPLLGKGTFGSVFKAIHKQTGKAVAIKMVNVTDMREGVSTVALREIKFLRELRSPHVVALVDVFQHKANLALVFELMESDLEAIIMDQSIVLSAADVKAYMQMLLQALATCHRHWVVHRDVKPNNMLLAPSGELKLGDFGLARLIGSADGRYTNQVFVRWYRAPELLFGSTLYTFAVDIWAAGCVFAELLLRRPWMPGSSDVDQLSLICKNLGAPSEDNWPGCSDLPCFVSFPPCAPKPLHQVIPGARAEALELMGWMLQLDPRKRPTAEQALAHPFFSCAPAPTVPAKLPRPQSREDRPLKAPGGAGSSSSSEELPGGTGGHGGARRALVSSDSEGSEGKVAGRQVRRRLLAEDDD